MTGWRAWVCLSGVWAGWGLTVVIVAPAAALRWRGRRFRLHWAKLSCRLERPAAP
jgi:hypothetical protein